jgi:hypothetical protein
MMFCDYLRFSVTNFYKQLYDTVPGIYRKITYWTAVNVLKKKLELDC